MLVTITEDYRIRFDEYPIAGDRCILKDGSRGVITKVYKIDGRHYYFAAPEELVNRAEYLKTYTNDGNVYPKWGI